MKSIILTTLVALFSFACQEAENISQEEPSPIHDGINWQGENEIANYLAMQGLWHYMNVERERAYVLFEKAVQSLQRKWTNVGSNLRETFPLI